MTSYPDALTELHRLYVGRAWDVSVLDVEIFDRFRDAVGWVSQWRRRPSPDAEDLRMFGREGAGGRLFLWLPTRDVMGVRPDTPLEQCRVVFLGSEGQTEVVAKTLGDFVVLLGHGFSPWQIQYFGTPSWSRKVDAPPVPNAPIRALVDRFFPTLADRAPAVIIEEARRDRALLEKLLGP